VSLFVPVTIGHFLSMLSNARNLSLTLTVKEYKTTLFSTDNEHWMSKRPRNVGGLIFLGGKLDVLELAFAHRPDRNSSS